MSIEKSERLQAAVNEGTKELGLTIQHKMDSARPFQMLDLMDAREVELSISEDNKVWLNIDGVCTVRVGKADTIEIVDHRIKNSV